MTAQRACRTGCPAGPCGRCCCALIRDETGEVMVLADPELLAAHGPLVEADEQCLSWPGALARLPRPEAATLGWYDLHGVHRRQDLHGPSARVVQRALDVPAGRFIGGF